MPQQKSDYRPRLDLDDDLDALASGEQLERAVTCLEENGFTVEVVEDADAALDAINEHVPAGAEIMNGHSTTLEEIGFVDHLKAGDHDWENLHDAVFAIEDDAERLKARREAQAAEYFLGSVNAITETGKMVAADASGSRVGAYPYAAQNVVIVSGTNKIVADLEDAQRRLEEFAYPLENERAQEAYGIKSRVAKQVILHHEGSEGRTHVILVKENLGY